MTPPQPKYLVDTCSLLELRRVYPLDVFPSVWDTLGELADKGIMMSVEEVFEELKVHEEDVVTAWAKKHLTMFLPLDEPTQVKAKEILEDHANLLNLRKRKSTADPFLIAASITHSCTLVTEEKPGGGPQRPRIPDVCASYGVRCVKLLDLLRAEGFRL